MRPRVLFSHENKNEKEDKKNVYVYGVRLKYEEEFIIIVGRVEKPLC